MEYKFCRELKHNYLVLKCDESYQDKKDSYQVKLLENGNLKGFIPCALRTINNEQFLYYEINSMQSLKDRFSAKGISKDELISLFRSLKDALEGLSEYLLGIENIIFDTKSIYVDLNSGDFKFMYCPFDNRTDFSSFADELFELVDHDDVSAVEMIYSCCEQAQNESALILDIIDEFLKASNNQEEETGNNDTGDNETCEYDVENQSESMEEIDDESELYEKEMEKPAPKFGYKVQLLFAFLFFALIAAMVFIRMNFVLSNEENILSIIVMIVSMTTGIVAFLSGVKEMEKISFPNLKNGVNRKKNYSDEDDELFQEDDNEEDTWNDYEQDESDDMVDEAYYKRQIKITNTCPETVMLDEEDYSDRDITLYSRNTDKTIRIPLGKLPLTIGKMEGCVDKVISDKSVSRIHCRFNKSPEGRLFLVDLNSTNGTFKNGLRLTPQEENYIEEGDEVRIGRICFDCR